LSSCGETTPHPCAGCGEGRGGVDAGDEGVGGVCTGGDPSTDEPEASRFGESMCGIVNVPFASSSVKVLSAELVSL